MTFTPSRWRLVLSPANRGAWNMAVDEAILEAIGRDEVLPTLRLYSWHPACLSLGYAQPIRDASLENLTSHGWDLVRRITGGRAILHTDELTYSVIGPANEPRLSGDVITSYRVLAQALLFALQQLGVPAESLPMKRDPDHKIRKNPVCFETPSHYEITINGKKMLGSAQARRKDGVLQHGSLPLCGDLTQITQALVFPDQASRQEAANRLLQRAATVETILNKFVSWDCAAQTLIQAFQEILQLELLPAELTANELSRAEQLVQDKYANREWTERV